MDAKLKRYYRKKMYGGRSLLARTVDFIMFRVAILVTIFIAMLQLSRSLTVAGSVSVLVTIAVSIGMYLYRQKKADKFFEKDLQRIREKCLLESLTVMNLKEFTGYIARIFPGTKQFEPVNDGFTADYKGTKIVVLHNHPSSNVSVAQVVDAYRLCKDGGKPVLISLSEYSADAKKFADSVSMMLVSGQEVLRLAGERGLLPDIHSAEERAKQEMEDTIISMENVRRSAFSRTKVKAYIFCGIVTMIWPLLGVWRIYYPIISILCFVMAFISFRKGKHAQENTGVGLT